MSRSVPDDYEYYLYQIEGKLCFVIEGISVQFLNILLYFMFLCINAGARRYLMKEPDSSLPACRRRQLRIMIIDRALRVVLFGYVFYKIFVKGNLFGFGDFLLGFRNDTIVEKF